MIIIISTNIHYTTLKTIHITTLKKKIHITSLLSVENNTWLNTVNNNYIPVQFLLDVDPRFNLVAVPLEKSLRCLVEAEEEEEEENKKEV